jgi:HEAT repeats
VENEQWVEAYVACDSPDEDREYYRYEDGSAAGLRVQHLPSLVQISDVDDGVYLLNPRAVTPDGEWEAWFFANWIPGATRYSSFAHLMVQEYRSFAETEMPNGSDFGLPALPAHAPNVRRTAAKRASAKRTAAKRPVAKRAPRRVSKSSPLVALIEQMGASDVKSRDKAVRTFVGHLQGRHAAKPQAELVKRLTDLFQANTDESVRCACLEGITEFADDGPLPQPLFHALSDPDPGVVSAGVSALSYFPDSRAVEPVCRLIESRENANFYVDAMLVLGEFGDERAVPALSKVLLDALNPLDQTFALAALALARCGSSGFDALVAALDHVDARTRHAAVAALDSTGDPRAAAYLDRMETDPDPRVRDRAKIRVGKPYGWK